MCMVSPGEQHVNRRTTWAPHTQCETQTTFPKDSPVCSARSFVQGLSLFRCAGSSQKLRETLPLCVHGARKTRRARQRPVLRWPRLGLGPCLPLSRQSGWSRALRGGPCSRRHLAPSPRNRRGSCPCSTGGGGGGGLSVRGSPKGEPPARRSALAKHLCSSPRRR